MKSYAVFSSDGTVYICEADDHAHAREQAVDAGIGAATIWSVDELGVCPFPIEDTTTASITCRKPLVPRGLIAGDFQDGGNELFRWDCENGHTILGEYTDQMGDNE